MLFALTYVRGDNIGKSELAKKSGTLAKVLILDKKKYHHGDLPGQLIEAVRQLIERDGPDAFKVAEAARLGALSTAASAALPRWQDTAQSFVDVITALENG